MNLNDLKTLEKLLSNQIAAGDRREVLQRKRAAVRDHILDEEAALARQQIQEAII